LAPEPRLTRRSYHFYAFRLDTKALGASRDAFVQALAAEGVPASVGWPAPLYQNPLFQRTGSGAEFCPRSCPYYGQETTYAMGSCPVCEQVCSDSCWISHPALLAGEDAMHDIVAAVAKICEHAKELA
jgi:dTDP-4-amino-4,6-dideoxygalactose transaminase